MKTYKSRDSDETVTAGRILDFRTDHDTGAYMASFDSSTYEISVEDGEKVMALCQELGAEAGYLVVSDDGSVTWLSADVFEQAYE